MIISLCSGAHQKLYTSDEFTSAGHSWPRIASHSPVAPHNRLRQPACRSWAGASLASVARTRAVDAGRRQASTSFYNYVRVFVFLTISIKSCNR
jgi:hypothetical protein